MGSICQPKLLVSRQGLGGSDLAAGIAEELLATPVGRGAVVAEGKEVVMVGCQDIEVPRLHLHVRACIMPEAEGIARIGAAEHDIEVVERAPATVHRLEDGHGVAVVRIDVAERAHGTDAGVGGSSQGTSSRPEHWQGAYGGLPGRWSRPCSLLASG